MAMIRLLIILFGVCVSVFTKDIPDPTVKIPDGLLQGHFSTSYGGKTYIEFTGIPYAKPPVDNLRFEDPIANNPWTGIWIANQTGACIQVSHYMDPAGGITEGTEDCLYLNVYVPDTKIDPTKKRDVIVFIHGGAFMFGSYKFGGPKFLMDRDAVYVNFNYRVGVLGFLSTGDKNLSGNLGMKDQVMALKWVNDNIEHFGGNKDSITLTGSSAGGASVHYHYFSPLSRGLFQRGISTSGCALNSWTMQEEPLVKARIIGKSVGCYQDDTAKLVECLKQRSAKIVTEAVKLLRSWLFNPFSPLGLVVDKSSDNPFLPEHPYKMLLDKNVYDAPWITSATTSEGLYPACEFLVKEHYLEDLNDNWEQYAPAIMHYIEAVPDPIKSSVSQRIKSFYMKDENNKRNAFDQLVQMIGDRLFVADLELSARLHSQAVKSPVYFYSYDYQGEQRDSLVYVMTLIEEKFGASHADDTMLIMSFPHEDIPAKMTERDEMVKDTLLHVWLSFSITGDPNIDGWGPVSKNSDDDFNYLYINPDGELKTMQSKEMGHRSFWESLPFEENANLFPKNVKTEL